MSAPQPSQTNSSSSCSCSWATLPPDILRIVICHLKPADLAACAKVCRSWRRIATSDDAWLPHLAARLNRDLDTLRRELHSLPSLGVLTVKDVYCFACLTHEFKKPEPNLFTLTWFRNFPFHPIRHGALRPLNLLRLARCWWTHRLGLGSLLGFPPSWLSASRKRCNADMLAHRRTRYGDRMERSARWAFGASLVALVCVSALSLSPYVDPLWGLVPLPVMRLALRSVPVAALSAAALSVAAVPDGAFTLLFLSVASYLSYASYPAIVWEYPLLRLALPVVIAVICDRVPTGTPPQFTQAPLLMMTICVSLC